MKVTILIFALSLLASCTTVQPWEREYLAKSEMQFSENKLKIVLHAQIHESKEASSGNSDAAGTGCGCN